MHGLSWVRKGCGKCYSCLRACKNYNFAIYKELAHTFLVYAKLCKLLFMATHEFICRK